MTSGVFTLPLFGIDTSSGYDNRHAGEGSWGFIAGPENALLRILIDAAASEQRRFNPITLCGPTGVGKSHLLLGVLNHVRTLAPQRKPWCMTGADFARQYARAIELDGLPELREKYNNVKLLIVDGLDELASKPAAQHELLQVVDQCLDRETQLLFSCQSANSQWSWMSPGLRSRLEGGLIIPVSPPAAATRIAIARQIGNELGVTIADEDLAGRQSTSRETYRDLKHAVLQLAATHDAAKGEEPTAEHPVAVPSSTSAAIRRISKAVARNFEIKYSELIGSSRRKTVVQARGVAIYLSRTFLGVSFEQLGKNFGNRDHTTVLHAYRKTLETLERDPLLKQVIDRLSADLAAQKFG